MPSHLVVGEDFIFGHRRSGNTKLLSQYTKKYHCQLICVPKYKIDGVICSSTNIRKLLTLGKVQQANDMLGYQYSYKGIVIKGRQMGRKIGFPTANIMFTGILENGVYSIKVKLDNKLLFGIANLA